MARPASNPTQNRSPGQAPTIAPGLPTRNQGFFSRTVVSERNNCPSRLSVNSTAWF